MSGRKSGCWEVEMKYFSEAWATGGLTDEQYDALSDAYSARIEEIKPQLSPELRELATNTNLHDGKVRRIALDRPARSLSISLRCWDLQSGFFDVDLAYADVDLNLLDAGVLQAIATDPATELLYEEIDLGLPGRFVHRIIFWPRPMREIEVVFRGLTVSTQPRPDLDHGKTKGTLLFTAGDWRI